MLITMVIIMNTIVIVDVYNRQKRAQVRMRECRNWSSRMKNYVVSFVT